MPGAMKELRDLPFAPSGWTPRYVGEIIAATWQNRREISYAWKILNHGVCDACSVGSAGLYDSVPHGLHSCVNRLRLLRQNTIGPLALAALSDVNRVRSLGPHRLRALGRLAYPMVRRKGQRGFLRVSWDEAIDVIAREIRQVTPNELAFLATAQGLTNEVYYVYQKLARTLGTNNLDLCSRLCRRNAVADLQATLGFGASTCSLSDLVGTDLLVLFGSDFPGGESVANPLLNRAKKNGTRVAIVNSAGGTSPRLSKLTDDSFQLRLGGDGAFVQGVLKFLLLAERLDTPFIERQTAGFAALAASLETLTWEQLEQRAGIAREAMQRFAESYGRARTAVFVYGEDFAAGDSTGANVRSVVNLALARGMVGKENCGILAIRADSGEQGAGECGVAPDVFSGGFAVREDTARRFSNLWHHPVPSQAGLQAPAVLRAACDGSIKVLYTLGCDPVETAPQPDTAEAALSRVPLRVHQDIMLSTSMLLDVSDAVVLLPGQTRYEQRTGGISTSTERRIRFNPELQGHRIGEALPDWEIPLLVGRRTMSNGDKLFPFADTRAIREEMSRVMPMYQGVEQLTKEGDQLQWGGTQLYKEGFTTMPQGRALFTVLGAE